MTSERAIATRCCWPPESSDGRWLAPVGEPHLLEQLVEPGLVGLLAGDRERQDDVLLGVEHRQEVEELEDEADVLAPQLRQLRVVEPRDLGAGDLHRARGRLVEAREDVHQGRLAGARRAHDRDELAGADVEVDAAERVDRGLALAVAARQLTRLDRRALGHDDAVFDSSLTAMASRLANRAAG